MLIKSLDQNLPEKIYLNQKKHNINYINIVSYYFINFKQKIKLKLIKEFKNEI
jgi:hypothetical protein